MKAVILDGYTLNPGDMDWSGFTKLCDCDIYNYTAPEDVLSRSRAAEILLTNKVVVSSETIAQLPKLRYIGVLATGYNVVDVDAARKRGIIVTNIPAYSTESVAQMVFAHLLNITMQVAYHADEVRKGRWSNNRDFTFWDKPLIALNGLTMGVIGLGHIGQEVAEIAHAFNMKVIAYTSKAQNELPIWEKKIDFESVFRESDVLSLHCPLTKKTEKLVNEQSLSWMKPSAILINTSRGGLIDEPALAKALNDGKIYAAGLDVLSSEPPKSDNPLLTARNCYITPHYAWATTSARHTLMDIAVANLKAFLLGHPQNVV